MKLEDNQQKSSGEQMKSDMGYQLGRKVGLGMLYRVMQKQATAPLELLLACRLEGSFANSWEQPAQMKLELKGFQSQ